MNDLNLFKNNIEINGSTYKIKATKMKYIRYNDFITLYAIFSNASSIKMIVSDELYLLLFNQFLLCVFDDNSESVINIMKILGDNNGIVEFMKIHSVIIETIKKINGFELKNKDDVDNNNSNDTESIDIEQGFGILGVWTGMTENELDEITYPMYIKYINEVANKMNFEMLSNLLGNAYAEKPMEAIMPYHSFYKEDTNKNKTNGKNRLTLDKLKAMGLEIENGTTLL